MKIKYNIIIFTDLDGSFLDHDTYDYTPALSAVNRLRDYEIPLIPVSSKTLAEIRALDFDFGDVPAIAENGMVIDVPAGFLPTPYNGASTITPAAGYEEIRSFINDLPDDLRIGVCGFGDMSISEVAQCTGLHDRGAALAKDRQGSEPFIWSGNDYDLRALTGLAEENSLKITRGGRFYHLMGNGGKETAIQWLLTRLGHKGMTSIALGDGANDRGMLSCVDYGVKIPNENGHSFQIENPRGMIINAEQPGPLGWGMAVNTLLDDLPFGQ